MIHTENTPVTPEQAEALLLTLIDTLPQAADLSQPEATAKLLEARLTLTQLEQYLESLSPSAATDTSENISALPLFSLPEEEAIDIPLVEVVEDAEEVVEEAEKEEEVPEANVLLEPVTQAQPNLEEVLKELAKPEEPIALTSAVYECLALIAIRNGVYTKSEQQELLKGTSVAAQIYDKNYKPSLVVLNETSTFIKRLKGFSYTQRREFLNSLTEQQKKLVTTLLSEEYADLF